MRHRWRLVHVLIGLAAVVFSAALTVLAAQAARAPVTWPAQAAAQPPAQQPTRPPAPVSRAAATYVGEETCLTCHAEMTRGYHDSRHGRKADERTPSANKGCESCHGPGSAHVEAGGDKTLILNPTTMKPSDVGAMCTTCHNRSSHSEWMGSKHEARSMSCATCHSVHAPKSPEGQLTKASERELCAQCHRRESDKTLRSSHMPVREGKMECSTCHNPHGSQNVRMLRQGHSIAESCVTCHAEKRGPFLWEHTVGRENCATCHDPHGSNNDRMLVAKVPMLCQRCHVHSRHPATIYDQTQVNNRSNRIAGRGCLNCHSMVHGSNHPSSGKYFMR